RLDLERIDRVRQQLELYALVLRLARVHGPEPDRARGIELLRTLLLIRHLAEEDRAVQTQLAVVELGLHAAFESFVLLDVERSHLERIRRSRTEAAASETRGPLHVSEQAWLELPVQSDLRRGLLRVHADAGVRDDHR